MGHSTCRDFFGSVFLKLCRSESLCSGANHHRSAMPSIEARSCKHSKVVKTCAHVARMMQLKAIICRVPSCVCHVTNEAFHSASCVMRPGLQSPWEIPPRQRPESWHCPGDCACTWLLSAPCAACTSGKRSSSHARGMPMSPVVTRCSVNSGRIATCTSSDSLMYHNITSAAACSSTMPSRRT